MNVTSDLCPPDGFFVFNTEVLFDRDGRMLVKYHKVIKFLEAYIDSALEQKSVVVETELGRLGVMTCCDILNYYPAVYLVQNGLVDTILFSTWWHDHTPYHSGSQIQMSWAIGNNINLIAANIHAVEVSFPVTWLVSFLFSLVSLEPLEVESTTERAMRCFR